MISGTLSYFGISYASPYYLKTDSITQYPQHPFRTDHYLFCLSTHGAIAVEIDGKTYTVGSGGVLLAAPSTVLHFLRISSDFRMSLLLFEEDFLLKNVSDPFILERLGIFKETSYRIFSSSVKEKKQLASAFQYLQKKSQQNGPFSDDIVRTSIFLLLLEAAQIMAGRHPETSASTSSKQIYLQFLQLIRQHANSHTDISFYANKLAISNKYLIEDIKTASGKTPHQLIDEAVLKQAIVHLGNPALNITEIAYALNFSSVAAFSRFFKRYTSISPSKYRQKEPDGISGK